MTNSDEYEEYDEEIEPGYLYFNDVFPITENITIYKPSVYDIFNYPDGEKGFYHIVNIFTGNTTSFRVALWDNGIDWNKITDFEMWTSMVVGLTQDQTAILFGDLDFSQLKPYSIKNKDFDEEGNEIEKESFILYNPKNGIEISEITYFRIRNLLRYMFGIFPRAEFTKGKRMKREMIRYDRNLAEKNSKDNSGGFLFPLVSALLNHPGFKYKRNELKDIGIFELMDSVKRIQLYESATATLKGMMSGFVDGSKIKPEQYDFMKNISLKPKSLKDEIKEVADNPWNIKES